MNRRLWLSLFFLAGSALLLVNAAQSNAPQTPAPAGKPTTPGVEAAQAVSTITGVAISPLLGVSAVGAWKYVQNQRLPVEKRKPLPWYAQPWFWIPGLLMVGLCFAKDVMGPAMPTALKKPIDVLEVFENKISALVVAGAFVPFVAAIFGGSSDDSSWFSGLGLAMVDPISLLNFLTVPVAIIAFLAVWMVAHVVNVLILISPFAVLDAALKACRFLVLATLTMIAVVNPQVGAALSVVIILIAFLLAGWAFRLTLFGSVFAWDLLTFRYARFTPKPKNNRLFTARRLSKVPVRTYGKLTRNDQNRLVLTYRPFLVLPARTLTLPEGTYAVGRGLIYPEVLLIEGDKSKTMLTLPPRYRTHEEEVRQLYQMAEVQTVGIVKGLKAVWRWLKALFGFPSQPVAAGAS